MNNSTLHYSGDEQSNVTVRHRADLIIDRYESAVRHGPDAIAVLAISESEDGVDRQVSYACLNRITDRIARRLVSCQIAPESIVGIAVDHDLATIAAILGVLKAGACFLPLGSSLPELRLKRIVDE